MSVVFGMLSKSASNSRVATCFDRTGLNPYAISRLSIAIKSCLTAQMKARWP